MVDSSVLTPYLRERSQGWDASLIRRFGLSAAIALLSFLVMVGGIGLATASFSFDGPGGTIALMCAAGIGVLMAFDVFRAERAHRRFTQQRRLLVDMLEGSGTARMISDWSDRQIYANSRFLALFPHRRAEPAPAGAKADKPDPATTGDLIALFGGGAEVARIISDMAAGARGGRGSMVELSSQGAGGVTWFRVSAHPIGGWPGHVQWRLEDVTARREMENAVASERARLTDFMENAPVGFFSVDGEGRFLFSNGTFARWLGMSVEALTTGTGRLHDFLVRPPVDGRPCDLVPEAGPEQVGEVVMRAVGGRVFRCAVAQSVVEDRPGAPLRTRAVARDLTPEMRWQEALDRSEQRFRRFFEDAPIGIALLDDRGRVVECNRALAEMLGLGTRQTIGQPVAALVAAADHAGLEGRLAEALRQGAAAPLELRLAPASDAGGRPRVCQFYANRYAHGEGTDSWRLILHFIDTTEQKNLELQFAQSQKMQAVGQLAGGIAHDFNNLLTAMIGFCDLLLLRHSPGDPSFDDIMQIKQNGNRAANLVRQLLAFSRQQTLQPRLLDLTDILTELAHLLRRLLGASITLEIAHGQELGLVRADQGQLEQVLINLAVNARDAMPTGGRLSIATQAIELTRPQAVGEAMMAPGAWISTTVSDTGTGIPPEVLPRIFEPFFSTKEVGSGTGLGLSTVYGIVHQTGGHIAVDSAPGVGTRFTIWLPRHAEGADSTAEPISGEVRQPPVLDLTGSATVQIVEDEDAVRVFAARALRNKGYHVLEADCGESALEQIDDLGEVPDLLITDVVMPRMDGTTLAHQLMERYPRLKVIFISGYAEDRFRHLLQEEGRIRFLPKPFTLKQLAEEVKEALTTPP